MKTNPIGHLVKTNPIRTQSNPIPQRDTQYAIRDTRYKPNQSQFQTRSGAEIPTGGLLGILKPGTNPPAPVFTPKTNVAPKKQP